MRLGTALALSSDERAEIYLRLGARASKFWLTYAFVGPFTFLSRACALLTFLSIIGPVAVPGRGY
jgi:hypothetical protein